MLKVEITFSEQAKALINELKIDEVEFLEWYKEQISVVGGGLIHHFLVDKVTKKYNLKNNGS